MCDFVKRRRRRRLWQAYYYSIHAQLDSKKESGGRARDGETRNKDNESRPSNARTERERRRREVKCRLVEFTLLINRQPPPAYLIKAGAVVPPSAASDF